MSANDDLREVLGNVRAATSGIAQTLRIGFRAARVDRDRAKIEEVLDVLIRGARRDDQPSEPVEIAMMVEAFADGSEATALYLAVAVRRLAKHPEEAPGKLDPKTFERIDVDTPAEEPSVTPTTDGEASHA